MAEGVEPVLPEPVLATGAPARPFQGSMEPLYLPLSLWMANAGQAATDALSHQPHQQLRPAVSSSCAPPGNAVIHQHGLGNTVTAEDAFQPLPHRLAACGADLFQAQKVTAMVVHHRQRTDDGRRSLL